MKWTPFQLAILGTFIFFIIGGIAVFAIFGGLGKNASVGEVVIWGTVDRRVMEPLLVDLTGADTSFQNVSYIEKKPETYQTELIEAFASGKAPDLFMLTDSSIVFFKDKVFPISYSTVSQRSFNDSFIDEGGLFLSPAGIIGLPLFVDPLVMYWNKDLFAGAGFATYPRAWSELATIAPKMTALDTTSNVKRSAVALGSYDNIRYAKEILSALFMQVGDPIVSTDIEGNLTSVLGKGKDAGVENPAQSALRFYSSFSNSTQSTYSWNRALPNSFNVFAAGDLGIYFGLASDYIPLRTRNPNLAFDVALLPQTGAAKAPLTYGRMTALAIPLGAPNRNGALIIIQKITSAAAESGLSSKLGLPAARRDVLSEVPDNSANSVFAQSALIARGWLDPNPAASGGIFKTMIESVISGKDQLGEAVAEASDALNEVFAK